MKKEITTTEQEKNMGYITFIPDYIGHTYGIDGVNGWGETKCTGNLLLKDICIGKSEITLSQAEHEILNEIMRKAAERKNQELNQ